jgi:hypothetical protein
MVRPLLNIMLKFRTIGLVGITPLAGEPITISVFFDVSFIREIRYPYVTVPNWIGKQVNLQQGC